MADKSATVAFRTDPAFKRYLECFANGLQMDVSSLVRTAVEDYTNSRVHSANERFVYRCLAFVLEKRGMEFEPAIKLIDVISEGFQTLDLEAWSNTNLVSDELFERLIDTRLKMLEEVPAGA